MKRILYYLLFLVSASIAQGVQTIAVLELEPIGLSKTEATTLTDRFRGELTKTGMFEVMARGEMAAILEEQEFQQSDCVDQQCAVELGQIIAVEKMVSGSVAKIGGLYTVNIKLLDVATGKIDKSISEDCDCPIEKLLLTTMNRLARKLAGQKVDEQTTSLAITRGDAFLFVKTDPADANIYIDGKLVDGKSPITLENLQAGEHSVMVRKGNLAATQKIVLESNKVGRVDLTLTQQETRVKIVTTPPDAEVFLSGELPSFKSKPDGLTPGVFSSSNDSLITFSLFKVGFKDTLLTVPIEPFRLNTVNVKLSTAMSDIIIKQEKLLKKRKQRKIGLIFDISGALVAGAGAGLLYLGKEDLDDAAVSKNQLESSIVQTGDTFEQLKQENKEKNDSGTLKQGVGVGLLGAGVAALSLGIVFTF